LNEHGAKLVADYKGRFGLFAMLPLPDVDSSLREIEYAFGPLKADGVAVMASYVNQWLGNVPFGPVFYELNRRQALVLAPPVAGPCCRNLQADPTPQTIEYSTDTSR